MPAACHALAMAEGDAERWDRKHASGHDAKAPDPRLLAALDRPELRALSGGRALDVACGTGRHALALARAGFEVLAVDVSAVALERLDAAAAAAAATAAEGLRVRTERRDLEAEGLPPGRFELVVVVDYLERSLFPELREAVAPVGCVFHETFSWRHSEATGFRRAFCLEPGELLGAFEGFEVLAHEEGELEGRFRESLLARRPRQLQSPS